MKSIFEYYDYQQYLRNFYEESKQQNSYVSYRYLGKKLKLDPGFLLKVIQGKNHLAEKSLPHLISFFKFSQREAEYFETLVHYSKAKTSSNIKLFFEKLSLLRESLAKPLQESQYAFYQKWYHSVIHALLSIYKFRGEYKKLASMLNPPISAKQAKESIRLLMELGMIRQNKEGVYQPVNKLVTSGEKWGAVAIRDFQKDTIRLSGEALERVEKDIRDISTVTVALSSKDLPEISERIRQLRQSTMIFNNENEPDTVFQINIQVIPVTKSIVGDQ